MNKNNKIIEFSPIGVIHTPHKETSKIPIQPVFAQGIKGTVEIYPEFIEGLKDLEQYSHIILFYYFHKSDKTMLNVKPYLQDELHGIFATRAPHRPNKIGMSVVKLSRIVNNILCIQDVDMLDETPLIDIKPYIARFDLKDKVRSGWQDEVSDNEAHQRGKRDYKKEEE
ncbi:MAG: tRNA (N6-threonylcarbamoyladenosine(37)-N6)-methyltransferase TrmO [Candidatus Cloacimonetes bacterium]|nr:tRNA (N6-threonylcarbamoyladenosine(37)-N6)-methyltransferase TrmO [Candidatus Cloacimonadota bacterium]